MKKCANFNVRHLEDLSLLPFTQHEAKLVLLRLVLFWLTKKTSPVCPQNTQILDKTMANEGNQKVKHDLSIIKIFIQHTKINQRQEFALNTKNSII